MKQRNSRSRTQQKGRGREAQSHPPQTSFQLATSRRLRFSVTTALTEAPITFQNLLDTIAVATSATTAQDLFTHVKVKAVEMWSVPVVGNVALVACAFTGISAGAAGTGRVISDTSMGIQPAHIIARPERMSQVGQYQPSGAKVAFELTCPVGAIIDLVVSFRNALDNGATATQNVPVAASGGQLFYRGLDGLAIATTQIPPQVPASVAF
jgi:hypothetical protein